MEINVLNSARASLRTHRKLQRQVIQKSENTGFLLLPQRSPRPLRFQFQNSKSLNHGFRGCARINQLTTIRRLIRVDLQFR